MDEFEQPAVVDGGLDEYTGGEADFYTQPVGEMVVEEMTPTSGVAGLFSPVSAVASAASPSGAMTSPVSAAAQFPVSNHLAEFNTKFRAQNEEKDAVERAAKAERKAAGAATLKSMLAERAKLIELRKANNRSDEAAAEKSMNDAASGESWARVNSMVDVHAGGAATASTTNVEAGTKKKNVEHVAGDVSRMKDVLIAVKNSPPPTA